MASTAKIQIEGQDLVTSLQGFFKTLLQAEEISALLVAQRLPMKNAVMPTLVTDPGKLDGADPLAPVFPINAAKVVSRLTRKPLKGKVAAVLRPCLRAGLTSLALRPESRGRRNPSPASPLYEIPLSRGQAAKKVPNKRG